MPPDAPTTAPAGRIAVLIPVYNERGRLRETLESLRAQSVAFTVVLVDDGSTPPLHVDVHDYAYPIVLFRMARNGGIEAALNAGLELIEAQGFEFVARLDVGDRCAPARLATQQAFLDESPDVHLVGSDVEWRHDDGSLAFALSLPSRHQDISRALHHTVCLIHPTVMFRTSVVRAVGKYSYEYPAAEDFEFFWRIARRFQVANVPEVLLVTRFDTNGISITRRRRQLRSKLRIQFKYFRVDEPLSFAGVAKTLALMSVPYSGVVALKGMLTRRRLAAP
ncbi:MAG: glycosyl transferase [Gemmatimonadetes bacterium]|nr:MAG: glycosyl transferase [Gemmatimonadota bacterium]